MDELRSGGGERAAEPSARAAMMKALGAMIFPLAVKAALELDVLPALERDEADVPALAGRLGLDPAALLRLLKALEAMSVLYRDGERFRVTPFGATLLPGPGSLQPLARYLLDDSMIAPLARLDECVRSGRPALRQDRHAGWYGAYPERARLMDGAMAVYSALSLPALLEAYDFTHYATITDVGGGAGDMLAAILAQCPGARGTLFDMPDTAERAARHLAARGQGGRCTVVAGDMLDAVPGGAQLYVLSKVLNNWDDGACVRILRNIGRAMAAAARLVVIEGLAMDVRHAAEDAFRDLLLLACSNGGRLRTEAELRRLGGEAGLTVVRVIPTASTFSIVEFGVRGA